MARAQVQQVTSQWRTIERAAQKSSLPLLGPNSALLPCPPCPTHHSLEKGTGDRHLHPCRAGSRQQPQLPGQFCPRSIRSQSPVGSELTCWSDFSHHECGSSTNNLTNDRSSSAGSTNPYLHKYHFWSKTSLAPQQGVFSLGALQSSQEVGNSSKTKSPFGVL